MIIIYILLGIIAIAITCALLQAAIKFISLLLGITIIPGLITLFLFGNFWIGAIIGIIIAIWYSIHKANKKYNHYHTCCFCESTDTEELIVSQELIDSINFDDQSNVNNIHSIIKCNKCGAFTVFSK